MSLLKRMQTFPMDANTAFLLLAESSKRIAELEDALNDACLTYAVHGDQPPAKWLKALGKE
jgi:hypothetical protein